MQLAGRHVRQESVELEGVDPRDYPDFCDAYFSYARFDDGTELTDDELEELTSEYVDVINMMAHEHMIGSYEDYGKDR